MMLNHDIYIGPKSDVILKVKIKIIPMLKMNIS